MLWGPVFVGWFRSLLTRGGPTLGAVHVARDAARNPVQPRSDGGPGLPLVDATVNDEKDLLYGVIDLAIRHPEATQ